MAYEIMDKCVNCWACEKLCPSQAIYWSQPHFKIDANLCSECDGYFADAQCSSICPIEEAILNPMGEWANPPGSLTGISPEKWARTMAEIQAR